MSDVDHFQTHHIPNTLLAIVTKYGFPIGEWACFIKHCWGVYEQNSIVKCVCVDDGTAE